MKKLNFFSSKRLTVDITGANVSHFIEIGKLLRANMAIPEVESVLEAVSCDETLFQYNVNRKPSVGSTGKTD